MMRDYMNLIASFWSLWTFLVLLVQQTGFVRPFFTLKGEIYVAIGGLASSFVLLATNTGSGPIYLAPISGIVWCLGTLYVRTRGLIPGPVLVPPPAEPRHLQEELK